MIDVHAKRYKGMRTGRELRMQKNGNRCVGNDKDDRVCALRRIECGCELMGTRAHSYLSN